MNADYISGRLHLEFSLDGGAALSAVRDGEDTLFSGRAELFGLTLLELSSRERLRLSSLEGWTDAQFSAGGLTLRHEKYPLRLRLELSPEPDGAAWTVSFVNDSAEYSVYSFEYPRASFGAAADGCVFFPARSGLLIRGLDAPGRMHRSGGYPASAAIMQYMAFCRENRGRGFYYGIHDISGAQKELGFEKPENAPSLSLSAEYICRDACSPRNSQTLNGRAVWRLFDGDWYDAAVIYRDFVLKEARWIPERDENGRAGAPEWIRRTAHWWLFSAGDDISCADALLKADAEFAGLNTAVHLYTWHRNPFDNDYPHYFPEKPFVPALVERLHAAGIKVMPYINGRLWDTRDRGAEDFLFTDEALPGATKNEKGEVFKERYGSKEADGSPVELAVMCPSSAVWGDKLNALLGELFYRLDVDAVYADQIASASAVPCCDPAHHHPAGGGGWWAEAYDRVLDRATRTLPPGKLITTESTAEPFIRHITGLLSWDSVEPNQVPAWSAVYAGYAFALGRAYSDADDQMVYALTAEAFTFGEQLGWIGPERYLALGDRGFYRDMIAARDACRDYFNAGRLLHPPRVSSDVPDIAGRTMHGSYSAPAVKAGIWGKSSGERLLAAINCSELPARAVFESPELPGGRLELEMPPHSVRTEKF